MEKWSKFLIEYWWMRWIIRVDRRAHYDVDELTVRERKIEVGVPNLACSRTISRLGLAISQIREIWPSVHAHPGNQKTQRWHLPKVFSSPGVSGSSLMLGGILSCG